jgi:ribosome-associated protein
MANDLPIRGSLVIPGENLEWTAVRASGPGGQNVNKVSSKVDLRFDLVGCSVLNERVKRRLRKLAAGRLDAAGRVVVTSQVTRNRVRNLEDARARLAELIRSALVEPKKRRPTKPSRAAKRRRLDAKRQQSEKKARRRQPRGGGDD